jgi:hypothetical protein
MRPDQGPPTESLDAPSTSGEVRTGSESARDEARPSSKAEAGQSLPPLHVAYFVRSRFGGNAAAIALCGGKLGERAVSQRTAKRNRRDERLCRECARLAV